MGLGWYRAAAAGGAGGGGAGRPLLVLVHGLCGGPQDTYIQSMVAHATVRSIMS